jgi:hypothetical protein
LNISSLPVVVALEAVLLLAVVVAAVRVVLEPVLGLL